MNTKKNKDSETPPLYQKQNIHVHIHKNGIDTEDHLGYKQKLTKDGIPKFRSKKDYKLKRNRAFGRNYKVQGMTSSSNPIQNIHPIPTIPTIPTIPSIHPALQNQYFQQPYTQTQNPLMMLNNIPHQQFPTHTQEPTPQPKINRLLVTHYVQHPTQSSPTIDFLDENINDETTPFEVHDSASLPTYSTHMLDQPLAFSENVHNIQLSNEPLIEMSNRTKLKNRFGRVHKEYTPEDEKIIAIVEYLKTIPSSERPADYKELQRAYANLIRLGGRGHTGETFDYYKESPMYETNKLLGEHYYYENYK